MTSRLAFVAAAALLVSSCRPAPAPRRDAQIENARGQAAAAERARSGAASAQEAAAVAAALRQSASAGLGYKISQADLLSVNVFGVPEMERRARVDANGMISLPLVGDIKVGGNTLQAAQGMIAQKLAAYVVDPQVSLFIEDYGSKLVYVMGEVQKPGSYPIPTESRMTVLEAISTAGGFTPVAAPDRTRVLRYVNGASTSYSVDVKSITRDGQKDRDIALQPNDVIYVPQSLF